MTTLSGIEKKAKGGTHLGAYVSKDLLSLGLSGSLFLLNENHDYNIMTICKFRVLPSVIESCAMIKRKI